MTKKQINIRVSDYTHTKLDEITSRTGMSKTEAVTQAISKFRETIDGYNGWSNYYTWDVALWLDNDYGHYTYIHNELIPQLRADTNGTPGRSIEGLLADAIQDYVEEQNPLASDASNFSDLLGYALRCVDWFEIAEHMLAE